jgi:RNA polymerase sigma factor (sigma-70 family)
MHEDPPIVFMIAGDACIRASLHSLVRCAGWQSEAFASIDEFGAKTRQRGVSCLVLDIELPGLCGMHLQELLGAHAHMPMVLVTRRGVAVASVRAMAAGTMEYCAVPIAPRGLIDTIRDSLERSQAALRAELEVRELRASLAELTPREREVMTLVVSGLLNKQVSARLGISEVTVKVHRGSVMRKMRARSFADLVAMGVKLRVDTLVQSNTASGDAGFGARNRFRETALSL